MTATMFTMSGQHLKSWNLSPDTQGAKLSVADFPAGLYYLRDLIETIPHHPVNRLEDLLPHRWQPNPDLPRWLHWQPGDESTQEHYFYGEE